MLSRKLLNFATLLPLLLLNNSIYNNTIFENHRLPTIPNPSHQTPFPIPSSEGARALPSSLKPGTKQDEPSKELPKFSVKLFLQSLQRRGTTATVILLCPSPSTLERVTGAADAPSPCFLCEN
ncbi:uncharacterized protein LOC107636018 isoform X2 [Arachis ipaensis]|uniref:uncharacterized protein LOC107636018 isoform X2 n=1 Tax=Arachis ipaensis TaxID=130454 RepID=UPI000A2B91B6|nr:uncharacterized protein LOC107636018 isoform X2 [Arachis ipaensis]